MKIEPPGPQPNSVDLLNGVWERQAFRIGPYDYMIYINRDRNDIDPERWHGDAFVGWVDDLSIDIKTACKMWVINSMGLSIYQYLSAMFNEI